MKLNKFFYNTVQSWPLHRVALLCLTLLWVACGPAPEQERSPLPDDLDPIAQSIRDLTGGAHPGDLAKGYR